MKNDHEWASDMISTFDSSPTLISGHEEIKRTDFVYFGIEEIRRSKIMNDKWMRKAKEARLVASKAKKHLQDMKEKVNLSNLARQKELDNTRWLFAQGKDVFCDEVDHSFEEDIDINDYTLSGPITQELSLEGNEGIYNSSLDWLPISYARAAIYLLVGDLLLISDGDSKV